MHDPPPGALDDLDDDPGPSPLVRTLRPVLITAVLAVLVLGGFALASHLFGDTRTETGELDLEGQGCELAGSKKKQGRRNRREGAKRTEA